MLKNPIAIAVLVVLVVAGGVWLYMYSADPLHTSCAKVNADPTGLGVRAADAVYDSLSDAARSRTTREGTRLHIVTVCQTADGNIAMSTIRDKIERELSADAAPH